MAYDIMNERGFVSGGPSIGGLDNIKTALDSISSATYPEMAAFLKYGFSTRPIRLKYEANALSKFMYDPTVKASLINIGLAASKSNDIVILHNHM